MSSHLRSYDVAVIGAGPVGCVTALAFAARGAEVLLLEANPKAAARLAGEWLHPPAVEILEGLGVKLEASVPYPTGRGFVVYPDDGSRPLVLPYASGSFGHSVHHETLVEKLRAHASVQPGVEYVENARATRIAGQNLTYQVRGGGTRTVFADQIVGASGRSSIAHAALGIGSNAGTYSRMAGLLLEDSELPFEGYGHVCLGGLGPILIYRISAREVRVCMDVPLSLRTTRDKEAVLFESYAPALPPSLHQPFRKALVSGEVTWATNQTRSRVAFGRPGLVLVGDAVGHHHPLTALGMTLGFQDAVALARAGSFAAYRRERTQLSRVPEMLAIALYEVFADTADEVIEIRRAIYELWRRSAAERLRTMRFLACQETSAAMFGASFLRALGVASKNLALRGASTSQWSHVRGITEELGSRIRWLMTGALHLTEARPAKELPRGADERYAGALRASAAKADVVELPSAAGHAARTGQDRWDPAQALERGARALAALQDDDGSFEGECRFCPLLTAQYVIALQVTGLPIDESRRRRLLLSFQRTQNDDGLWSMSEGTSLLVTTLVYVAARLLGVPASDPLVDRARAYFMREGGVQAIPTWGRAYLATLGLYDWDGVRADALPREIGADDVRGMHAALAVLHAERFTMVTPVVEELKRELFPQGLENVDFRSIRLEPPADALSGGGASTGAELARAADALLSGARARRRTVAKLRDGLRAELRAPRPELSPATALLAMLAVCAQASARPAPDPDVVRAAEWIEGWIWEDDRDGARVAPLRTVVLDTALAVRALGASGDAGLAPAIERASRFLGSQAPDAPSDFAGEAVSALLSAGPAPSDDDLAKLVGGLLRCQGADGSFGAYVPPRAPRALVARDGEGCSSSVERAASAVWALSRVVRDRPALLKRAELGGLERAVAQGAAWIRRQQLPEGSWRGIRGVQHISGTLFAIRGLIAAGVPSIDPAIRKACAWLKAHQAPDGSWGERYSARSAGYVEHSDGQIVQTAWALIALLEAHEPEWDVLDRAARYLAREQLGSGEWPRQAPAATVFPGALADMSLDRSYFPVWALGLFEARRKLRNELIDEVKRQVAAE